MPCFVSELGRQPVPTEFFITFVLLLLVLDFAKELFNILKGSVHDTMYLYNVGRYLQQAMLV